MPTKFNLRKWLNSTKLKVGKNNFTLLSGLVVSTKPKFQNIINNWNSFYLISYLHSLLDNP